MLCLLCSLLAPAHGRDLTLTMGPLVHGYPLEIGVFGAEPGDRVQVIRGNGGLGRGRPTPGGGHLGIRAGDGLSRVLTARADADGHMRWYIPAFDPAIPEGDWYFQALVVDGDRTWLSEPIARPVRAEPLPMMDDLYEPNDSRFDAVQLPGSSFLSIRRCSVEQDWFRIVVPSGEALEVHTNAAVDVAVFGHGHEPLTSTDRGLAGTRWENHTTEARPVWIAFGATGFWDDDGSGLSLPPCREVDVDVHIQPLGTCIDDGLMNPDPGSAAPIDDGEWISGALCPLESDWFSFTPQGDGPWHLELEQVRGTTLSTLFDSSGNYLRSTQPFVAGETYSIRLDPPASQLQGGSSYRLSIESQPAPDLCATGTPPLEVGDQEVAICTTNQTFTLPTNPGWELEVAMPAYPGLWATVGGQRLDFLDHEHALTWRGTTDSIRTKTLRVRDFTGVLPISVDLREPARCLPDRFEPNDAGADAATLPPHPIAARACAEDVDHYIAQGLDGVRMEIRLTWASLPTAPPLIIEGQRFWPDEQGRVWYTPRQDGPFTIEVPVVATRSGGEDYILEVTPSPPSCEDRHEPNDSLLEARPLAVGEPIQAAICAADQDWYLLDVPTGDSVEIILSEGCGVVVDITGTVLTSGCRPGTVTVDQPSYLRVEGTSHRNYWLEITQAAQCIDDLLEPNESSAEAQPLLSGVHPLVLCDQGEDWFAVDLTAGDQLDLLVAGARGEWSWPIATLRNPSGQTVETGQFVRHRAEVSGEHHIRVSYAGHDDAVSYALDLSVSPMSPCIDDSWAPNDSQSTAIPIAPQGADATACLDATDWWRVDVEPGQDLLSMLTYDIDEGFVTLQAFDASGFEVPTYVQTSGQLYVSVTLYVDRGSEPGVTYQLHPPTNRCPVDDHEPNDDPGAATPAASSTRLHGTACLNEEDHFSVWAEAGEELGVAFSVDRLSDVDVELRGPSGLLLTSGTHSPLTAIANTTGLHDVRVLGIDAWDQGGGVDYDLYLDRSICDPDALEPDNTVAEASELLLGVAASAVACPEDVDLHEIALAAGEAVSAEVLSDARGLRVELQDVDGLELSNPYQAPADEVVYAEVRWNPPQVFGRRLTGGAAYTLVANAEPPCVADPVEPDDVPQDAPIRGAGTWTGTACRESTALMGGDWSRVFIARGNTLRATLSFDGNEGDLDLLLYDSSGRLLQWSTHAGDEERVEWTAPSGQAVFLRTYLWRDKQELGLPYELQVTTD